MELCKGTQTNRHDEVCFSRSSCPTCELIKFYNKEIIQLKETKSLFVCEINDLEEEIAVLRKET